MEVNDTLGEVAYRLNPCRGDSFSLHFICWITRDVSGRESRRLIVHRYLLELSAHSVGFVRPCVNALECLSISDTRLLPMSTVEFMPVFAGVRLGSAVLQVLAEDAGVDVLHIKGPAVHPSLLQVQETSDPVLGVEAGAPRPRNSVDVDLLVRSSHIDRLFGAMREHGWQMAYRFEDGSAFEHASTWTREGLCTADIHRQFPGIGVPPGQAFELLWAERQTIEIAGYPCHAPSLPAQRLILILHATRGGDLQSGDIQRAWWDASPGERAEMDELAATLGAKVALSAGTGRLDQHRGAREHDLWLALSSGDVRRLTLWKARVKAQPTLAGRVRMGVRLAVPKPGRLSHNLGRPPNVFEIAAMWGREARTVGRELSGVARRLLVRRRK